MELNQYQDLATATKQKPKKEGDSLTVSLLGLACEATGPLAEFKKHIRDGDAYKIYPDRMLEELGDVLWYLASVASEFNLTLQEIAETNLKKTQERWGQENQNVLFNQFFDDNFPPSEQIPRRFIIRFLSLEDKDRKVVIAYLGTQQMGQSLTDNAHDNDGYRFHDVFHLACAAVLGWSPVVRRNLGFKRRSNTRIDEIEDGGRAIVTEEAISALVFDYALSHDMFADVVAIDYELLRTIGTLAGHFEVKTKRPADWENTILQAYSVWRELSANSEGFIICDLNEKAISFERELNGESFYNGPRPSSLINTHAVEV
ncbi:hypothetical protein CCAX7_11400 [Capsulimonas corticalis]|uniref:Uncharacterized protein n=1 Tax=Capsulimonas corticalis TaxID=2219043 RepID=A0A402CUU1_9BACT|nr:nucleoside triphosphate pyrophosphohydrolase family protein [Capsulimonas corticalis]BDI29089.1 hypothetical protein CCAX7_11400 [Capsulimonas corticalis]